MGTIAKGAIYCLRAAWTEACVPSLAVPKSDSETGAEGLQSMVYK